ncbi:MAG: hypothetical protein KGS09_11530 [Nitrospirae bacterium]|nr:hypothetical protein [Nitrospirota bacterium]MDE3039643.1 hypothetical protein [Nitrospirota bacterium]
MPKAKPVSLHPLSFDAAIKALIRVVPTLTPLKKKRATVKSGKNNPKKSV